MEKPEPIIFNASLDDVHLKRGKLGTPPEVVIKLSASVKPADLPHMMALQEMYMQVAFAPAQAVLPIEPQG